MVLYMYWFLFILEKKIFKLIGNFNRVFVFLCIKFLFIKICFLFFSF